jgi:hypothetical protein
MDWLPFQQKQHEKKGKKNKTIWSDLVRHIRFPSSHFGSIKRVQDPSSFAAEKQS